MRRDSDAYKVFRCDYCGTDAQLVEARIFWTETDTLSDGRRLHLPAVYCSPYCGQSATRRSGSGRG